MNRKEFFKHITLGIVGSFAIPTLMSACNESHNKKAQKSIVDSNQPLSYSVDELTGKADIELISGVNYQLRKEVAEAFEKMKAAALKAGFKIHVVSSYRSYDHQSGIWTRKYNQFKASGLKPLDCIKKIIDYSTIPGTSRHHWGTDLDIIDGTNGVPSDPLNYKHFLEGGKFYKFRLWLDENAEKFGFYLVYTDTKDRKGFKYEPWHFSYKALSYQMLKEYQLIDIKAILQKNKLTGSEFFTDDFIHKYINENILDINKDLL